MLIASLVPLLRDGGGSDGSAPCCGMSGCPSPWPWPSFRTIPQRDRGWPGPGCGGHEQNYTAKIRKPPTPQPELFILEEEPGGSLPAPLSEVAGRQEKVVRHVLEDLGSVCPFVQILDLPVPQMVGDVTDALRFLDRPMAEQVIEVPRISCSPCPSRSRVLSRRRRNSWWKFRLCCLSPGSRSSSSTLQFLRVVACGVSKVFSQCRVQ